MTMKMKTLVISPHLQWKNEQVYCISSSTNELILGKSNQFPCIYATSSAAIAVIPDDTPASIRVRYSTGLMQIKAHFSLKSVYSVTSLDEVDSYLTLSTSVKKRSESKRYLQHVEHKATEAAKSGGFHSVSPSMSRFSETCLTSFGDIESLSRLRLVKGTARLIIISYDSKSLELDVKKSKAVKVSLPLQIIAPLYAILIPLSTAVNGQDYASVLLMDVLPMQKFVYGQLACFLKKKMKIDLVVHVDELSSLRVKEVSPFKDINKKPVIPEESKNSLVMEDKYSVVKENIDSNQHQDSVAATNQADDEQGLKVQSLNKVEDDLPSNEQLEKQSEVPESNQMDQPVLESNKMEQPVVKQVKLQEVVKQGEVKEVQEELKANDEQEQGGTNQDIRLENDQRVLLDQSHARSAISDELPEEKDRSDSCNSFEGYEDVSSSVRKEIDLEEVVKLAIDHLKSKNATVSASSTPVRPQPIAKLSRNLQFRLPKRF